MGREGGQRGRKKGKEYSRTSKRKDIRKGKQKEGEGQEIYETRKRGMRGRGQGRERRKESISESKVSNICSLLQVHREFSIRNRSFTTISNIRKAIILY